MKYITVDIEVAADCVVAGVNAALCDSDVRNLARSVDKFAGELRELVPVQRSRRPVRTSRLVRLSSGALGTQVKVSADVTPSQLETVLGRLNQAGGRTRKSTIQGCGQVHEAAGAPAVDQPDVGETAYTEAACAERLRAHLVGQAFRPAVSVEETSLGAVQVRAGGARQQPASTSGAEAQTNSAENTEHSAPLDLSEPTDDRPPLELSSPPAGIDDVVEASEAVYLLTLADGSTVVVPAEAVRFTPEQGASLSKLIELRALRERTYVLQELRRVPG